MTVFPTAGPTVIERETRSGRIDERRDEAALLNAVARGDAVAARAFVERFEPRVAAFTNRLMGWRGDVDDVVQDVFVAAIESARSFRAESSLATWLLRITLNVYRARRRRARLHERLVRWWQRGGVRAAETAIDATLTAGEAYERVREAVRALENPEREVVVLRYLEELEIGAIASLLGVARNTVDARLSRARKNLRGLLRDLEQTDHA